MAQAAYGDLGDLKRPANFRTVVNMEGVELRSGVTSHQEKISTDVERVRVKIADRSAHSSRAIAPAAFEFLLRPFTGRQFGQVLGDANAARFGSGD